MGDHCSGRDWDRRIDGTGDLETVTRRPRVTEDLDEAFELLCDRRRRFLLYFLFVTDDDVVELETVANAVASYEEAAADANGATDDDRAAEETVRIELHHRHLPRLADADVVDYDRRQGTVRFQGDPRLEEWAEHAHYKEID